MRYGRKSIHVVQNNLTLLCMPYNITAKLFCDYGIIKQRSGHFLALWDKTGKRGCEEVGYDEFF